MSRFQFHVRSEDSRPSSTMYYVRFVLSSIQWDAIGDQYWKVILQMGKAKRLQQKEETNYPADDVIWLECWLLCKQPPESVIN